MSLGYTQIKYILTRSSCRGYQAHITGYMIQSRKTINVDKFTEKVDWCCTTNPRNGLKTVNDIFNLEFLNIGFDLFDNVQSTVLLTIEFFD